MGFLIPLFSRLMVSFRLSLRNRKIAFPIEKELYKELKKFYNIGLFNKSIDVGFPVFDILLCEKFKSEYTTYSGVREYYNSLYYVILNGNLREK